MNATLPTTEQRQAVKDKKIRYIMAKSKHEANIEINRIAGDQVLAENLFLSKEDEANPTKRIEQNSDSYLMDKVDFERFCKLRHARRQALGLRLEPHPTIEDWDLSADAYSREVLHKAEDALIAAGTCFLPDYMQDFFKSKMTYTERKKLIKIILEWNTDK
jgi:hypothetical protein